MSPKNNPFNGAMVATYELAYLKGKVIMIVTEASQ